MKHAVEHLRFPEAAVEAVTEFCQITGQMLGADPMMDATNIAFNIGDQSMHPRQDLRGLFARSGNQPFVTAGGVIQKTIVLPTVGFNQHFFHQTRWPLTLGTRCMLANLGLLSGVSTATTTLALPAAPRPRFPGLGAPK